MIGIGLTAVWGFAYYGLYSTAIPILVFITIMLGFNLRAEIAACIASSKQ